MFRLSLNGLTGDSELTSELRSKLFLAQGLTFISPGPGTKEVMPKMLVNIRLET